MVNIEIPKVTETKAVDSKQVNQPLNETAKLNTTNTLATNNSTTTQSTKLNNT
jgi:hypothetical protein